MRIISISLILLTGLFFNSFAQQNTLDEAWSAFNESNYQLAQSKFETAATNESTKAEANLALSILFHTNNEPKKSFDHFQKFYTASSSPLNELYALWKTESVTEGRGKLTEEQLNFLSNIDFSGEDGMYTAVNNEFLNQHYIMVNKVSTARKYSNESGVIKNWSVVGNFDNVSASGFNKTHGVLENPKNNSTFKNKNNAEISWFDVPYMPISNWLATTNYFVNDDAVIYGQAFVLSPSEQNLQIRVGAYGSYRLWVNDVLVMEEEEEQVTDVDAHIVNVKLNSGTNRILVQMGCSELSNSGIFVRLTDKNGKGIEDTKITSTYSEYKKGGNENPTYEELPAEKYFKAQIQKNPSDILNYILLYYTYNHNGKTQKNLQLMKKASELFPKNTLIKSFMIDVYGAVDNETDMSKNLEQLKEMAPNSYQALVLEFGDEKEKEEYEKAEEILDKIINKYGEDITTTMFKIQLASAREQNDNLINIVKNAFKKYPENSRIVYLRYLIYDQVENKKKKGIKTLKKFLKNNYNYQIYQTLAEAYFQSGNGAAGIGIYQNLANTFPEETEFAYTLGQIYSGAQRYNLAIDYFKECQKVAPYASGYMQKLAECYEEMGEDELAIEYYNKVIEYARYDFDAREKVRVLNGEDKLFEQFPEVIDPEDALKESPIAKDLPEDNAVILIDETHKIVHEDGPSESRRYLMVKVLNASGVDSWKEYSVGTSGKLNIEEAIVYKADGSKVEADVNYNYIVFTGLEEGDAIYVQYKREKTNYGKLSKHFWSQHYFEYFMPAQENNYYLLVHKNKKFNYEVTNGKIEPEISDKGDYKMYAWKTGKKAGLKTESYMPELVDISTTLHLSSFEDWNEVVDWYIDLSQSKQKADIVLKETVEELFKGKENLTDIEKTKLIYDYITNEIRYSSVSFRQSGLVPQKASKVISTKLGDCKDVSTLFVTMCKEVGLDASLVLVNTRNNGDKDVYLPSIDFNHCIAKINLDNQDYYIELTSDLIPFSTHGNTLRYATVLDIEPGNQKIQALDVPTRAKNEIRRNTELSFSGEDMTVKVETEKSGSYSGEVRSSYRDIGDEKRRKNIQENINDMYVKTKLQELAFDETLDSNTNAVSFNYEYLVEDVFNDVGGILIFKLPWSDKAVQVDFLSDEARKLPIALWRYSMADIEYEKITINLPSGKKLVKAKPDDIVINNEFFSYSLIHKKVGGKLIITRTFSFKKHSISVDEYQKFKDSYEKVIKADTRQLAFNA